MRLSRRGARRNRGFSDVISEQAPSTVRWVSSAMPNGVIELSVEGEKDIDQPDVRYNYDLYLNKSDLIQIFAALAKAKVSLEGVSTLSPDTRELLDSHIAAVTGILKGIPG